MRLCSDKGEVQGFCMSMIRFLSRPTASNVCFYCSKSCEINSALEVSKTNRNQTFCVALLVPAPGPGKFCRDCDATAKRGYPGEKREVIIARLESDPKAFDEFQSCPLARLC